MRCATTSGLSGTYRGDSPAKTEQGWTQGGPILEGIGATEDDAMRRVCSRAKRAGCPEATGVVLLQCGEVELGDRLVDEPALILCVEHLAGDAGRGLEREIGDLGANQVERALRLGVDLALRLLEPASAFRLGLLLHARDLRVRDLACVREDVGRLALRIRDQLAVLLEKLARLVTRLVGLVHGRANAVAAVVDGLLDRPEREPPQDEERDREADQGPDHQTRDDLDQAGCE